MLQLEKDNNSPIPRLERRLKELELKAKLGWMEIHSPEGRARIRREIEYEKNVKKALDLQKGLINHLT